MADKEKEFMRPIPGRPGDPYGYKSRNKKFSKKHELGEFGKCVKYMMFVFNIIIFFLGLGVVGVGIWIAVDQNYMTNLVGTLLFQAAVGAMLAGGFFVVFISFLGFVGAITENRLMIGLYMLLLVLIAVLLMVAAILGFVFRGQLHERVRSFMSDTLTNSYGVNLYEGWNRGVTWSWDTAQERLHCCAVDDQGWALYRASEWYKEQPGIPGATMPYVPLSCCKRNQFGEIIDQVYCQTWKQGPPGQNTGAFNGALHYKGCYNRGREWLFYKSGFMIGIGMAISLFLIGGILCSAYLFYRITNEETKDKIQGQGNVQ